MGTMEFARRRAQMAKEKLQRRLVGTSTRAPGRQEAKESQEDQGTRLAKGSEGALGPTAGCFQGTVHGNGHAGGRTTDSSGSSKGTPPKPAFRPPGSCGEVGWA